MQNIYAALLLHSVGKEIDDEGIKKIVHAAGGTADESSIKSLIASLKGVDINQALEEAKSAPVAVAASAPAEKKEEKKEEPKPEIAAEGLASLFG
jgi:large subunit ribosomal protein L12